MIIFWSTQFLLFLLQTFNKWNKDATDSLNLTFSQIGKIHNKLLILYSLAPNHTPISIIPFTTNCLSTPSHSKLIKLPKNRRSCQQRNLIIIHYPESNSNAGKVLRLKDEYKKSKKYRIISSKSKTPTIHFVCL